MKERTKIIECQKALLQNMELQSKGNLLKVHLQDTWDMVPTKMDTGIITTCAFNLKTLLIGFNTFIALLILNFCLTTGHAAP
jgi:hypothetical protein